MTGTYRQSTPLTPIFILWWFNVLLYFIMRTWNAFPWPSTVRLPPSYKRVGKLMIVSWKGMFGTNPYSRWRSPALSSIRIFKKIVYTTFLILLKLKYQNIIKYKIIFMKYDNNIPVTWVASRHARLKSP